MGEGERGEDSRRRLDDRRRHTTRRQGTVRPERPLRRPIRILCCRDPLSLRQEGKCLSILLCFGSERQLDLPVTLFHCASNVINRDTKEFLSLVHEIDATLVELAMECGLEGRRIFGIDDGVDIERERYRSIAQLVDSLKRI